LQWLKKNKAIITLLGVFLIFAGIFVFIVTTFEINGLEEILANENLSIDEAWRFEGALRWWRNTYFTVMLPVVAILMISGLATLMGQVIFFVFGDMGT